MKAEALITVIKQLSRGSGLLKIWHLCLLGKHLILVANVFISEPEL